MTRGNLKVGLSIWTFTPNTGGLQSHAENLCQHLVRRGHEVRVITRSATRVPQGRDYLFFDETVDELPVAGIPTRLINLSRCPRPLLWLILKAAARRGTAVMAARLYEMAAAQSTDRAFQGFDIIHHVGHATAFVGLAAARSARRWNVPFVVQPTAHPQHFGDTANDLRLYGRADRLLVHTHYEQDYFVRKGIQCPMDVVYNGIEDRSDGLEARFRERHQIQGPIILFLGRKSEDKGYFLLQEAFAVVKRKHPELTLVCIGPSDRRGAAISRLGVLELDFVSEQEKHDALAACNCLCVPSTGESFGLVYMEAARYGKPSIGRNVPVLRELLGDHGAIIMTGTPNDAKNTAALSADQLAEAMTQIVEQPERARDIGLRARKISDAYLWPKVVTHFESAYRSATQSVAK